MHIHPLLSCNSPIAAIANRTSHHAPVRILARALPFIIISYHTSTPISFFHPISHSPQERCHPLLVVLSRRATRNLPGNHRPAPRPLRQLLDDPHVRRQRGDEVARVEHVREGAGKFQRTRTKEGGREVGAGRCGRYNAQKSNSQPQCRAGTTGKQV